MKILTFAEYETRSPKKNGEYFNSLSIDEKSRYLKLQALYYDLEQQYLMEMLSIDEADKALSVSVLNFKRVDEENKDIYQYQADRLNFFYIRNNIYIERLNESEREYLETKLKSNNCELNDKDKEFIETTIYRVSVEETDNTKKSNMFYGSASKSFMESNDSIIIGFRYNEFFVPKGQSDDEWEKNYTAQRRDAEYYLSKLEFDIQVRGMERCAVLMYNEYSIDKRQ